MAPTTRGRAKSTAASPTAATVNDPAERPAKRTKKASKVTKQASKVTKQASKADGPASGSDQGEQLFAFLRGVNVGGRTHSMASIAEALSDAGFRGVSTFLASGNILFRSNNADEAVTETETRVESELEDLFGSEIAVMVRSKSEIERVVAAVDREAEATNVVLLKQSLTKQQREALGEVATAEDELVPLDKEFLWFSATKISASPLFKVSFEKQLGVRAVTVRNVNTLRRLLTR